MKIALLAIAFYSLNSFAGSCCLGSGPRSFVQLKHLQSFDLGLATSFRDVYARFSPYGDRVKAETQQTATLALGGSVRLTPRSELYSIIPFVNKSKAFGGETRSRLDLGDVTLGTKVLLFDPFFDEDWFPETKILASVKAPTGRRDTLSSSGAWEPGTGNGIWEASLGFQFSKDLRTFMLGFSPSYTRRFSKAILSHTGSEVNVREGDRIELTETVIVPVGQSASLSFGGSQVFDFNTTLNGGEVTDSGGRYTTGFLGGSYFITRLWTVSAAFESVLPFEKISVNQEAYRTVTVTTTYAIY